jgi:hypothetical protein
MGIGYLTSGTNVYMLHGTATELFSWAGSFSFGVSSGTNTSILSGLAGVPPASAFGGARPTTWSVVKWGNVLLASGGISGMMVQRVLTGLVAPIPTSENPQILAVLGPHVLGFNYSSFGSPNSKQTFRWCSADDEMTWTPAAANSAGDLVIREFASEIVAAVPFQNKIAVFSETSMAMVSYVGAPYYFGYEVVITEELSVGSKRSVIVVGDLIYGWGHKGFFKTDGISVTYFGDEMHRYIQSFRATLNLYTYYFAHGVLDTLHEEIQWYLPGDTNFTFWICAVYNYKTDSWYIRNAGKDASSAFYFSETQLVITVNNGYLSRQQHENYQHTNGVGGSLLSQYLAVSKAIEVKKSLDGALIGEEFVKFIQSIRLDVTIPSATIAGTRYGTPELLVGIAFLMSADEVPVYWSVQFGFAKIYPLRSARYIKFKIEYVTVGQSTMKPFTLEGIQVCGKVLGNNPGVKGK